MPTPIIQIAPVLPKREPTPAQERLIGFVSGLIRSESKRQDLPATIDPRDLDAEETLTSLGSPARWTDSVQYDQAMQLWGLGRRGHYRTVLEVSDLAEHNAIFSPIIQKLARTIGEVETELVVEDPGRADVEQIQEIWEAFKRRTDLDAHKPEWCERALNQGGLSLENVLNEDRVISDIEYRPHHLIFPQKENGRFTDMERAWVQFDGTFREIASFAHWQISDSNLRESAEHDRGIPHLQAARDLVSKAVQMLRGIYQKFVREGGSIEHFNIGDDANSGWKEIEKFRANNKDNLEVDPTVLVRQFFSTGPMKIERLVADSKVSNDGLAVDLFLELTYIAAGVSSAIMGYKTHLQIKDATTVLRENYFQTLGQIQGCILRALRQSFDIELLLHGVNLEALSYRLEGGRFKVDIRPEIQPQAFAAGAYTLNQLLAAGGFESVEDPIFNAPGIKLSQKAAVQFAIDKGLLKESDEIVELLRGPDMSALIGAPGEGSEEPEDDAKPGKPNGANGKSPPRPRA